MADDAEETDLSGTSPLPAEPAALPPAHMVRSSTQDPLPPGRGPTSATPVLADGSSSSGVTVNTDGGSLSAGATVHADGGSLNTALADGVSNTGSATHPSDARNAEQTAPRRAPSPAPAPAPPTRSLASGGIVLNDDLTMATTSPTSALLVSRRMTDDTPFFAEHRDGWFRDGPVPQPGTLPRGPSNGIARPRAPEKWGAQGSVIIVTDESRWFW